MVQCFAYLCSLTESFIGYAYRLPTEMPNPVLGDVAQEAMHVLLPQMLRPVPVCAAWHLRQQANVSLLQQLEDQGRWPQVPLDFSLGIYIYSLLHGFLIYFVNG